MSIQHQELARRQATKNRLFFLLRNSLWILPVLMSIYFFQNPPENFDPAVLYGVTLLLVIFAGLMFRDSHREYQRRHMDTVIPQLLRHESNFQTVRAGSVSLLSFAPSRLFPHADNAYAHSYLRGHIADHLVEVCALSLTRRKVRRNGRRVTAKVFEGACFHLDLGAPVLSKDLHIFGPRASRGWGLTRFTPEFVPFALPGVGFGARAWGEVGAWKDVSKPVRAEIKEIFKIAPTARISLFGGRNMMIVLPGERRLFRPAGIFFTPSRDPQVARMLEIMRRCVRSAVLMNSSATLVDLAFDRLEEKERAKPKPKPKPQTDPTPPLTLPTPNRETIEFIKGRVQNGYAWTKDVVQVGWRKAQLAWKNHSVENDKKIMTELGEKAREKTQGALVAVRQSQVWKSTFNAEKEDETKDGEPSDVVRRIRMFDEK